MPENKSAKEEISTQSIKVGVFDGHEGTQICIWKTVAVIRLDPEMEIHTTTTADIASNVLDSTDAVIIPGGSGRSQYLNPRTLNQQRVKDLIAKDKGAVGICAGTHLFSNTPNYTRVQLNRQQAIDIKHDNRGHGLAKFILCGEGKKIFPELVDRDTSFAIYYERPIFINNPVDMIQSNTLAIIRGDTHEEGNTPANMINSKPLFVANNCGEGRAPGSTAHPEGTPGITWMIPRMARWTLNRPFIPHQSFAIRPDLFNHESLMATDNLKQEEKAFQIFLSGEDEQKAAALDRLEAHHSWDTKRWVQGLPYNASPAIRIRAARYVADTHYLPLLPSLQAAYRTETGKAAQEELRTQLEKLTVLLPQARGI